MDNIVPLMRQSEGADAMNLEPNDLMLFARVVDDGSFSRAAERAGLPKSTVSRRVADARGAARRAPAVAHHAQAHGHRLRPQRARARAPGGWPRSRRPSALAQQRQVQPSGRLRVSMPADFANGVLAQLLSAFVAQHPAISLELDLSPRRVDLIGENFDLAIRMGDLPDDASLAARRLARVRRRLYASPAYLKRRGAPQEPEALMEHDALRILTRSGEPMRWVLTRGEARWEGMPPGARHRQLTRPADPHGTRRRRHHRRVAPLRRALPAQRRTRAGARGLVVAARRGLGGVPRPPSDAGAHARIPRRVAGRVRRAQVPGAA